MDELDEYLKCSYNYIGHDIEKILNKKIIITDSHIKNINFNHCHFNIIALFEKYGYIFTNEIYEMIIQQDGWLIRYFSEDNKIFEKAIRKNGWVMRHIFKNNNINELCKTEIQHDKWEVQHVSKNIYL